MRQLIALLWFVWTGCMVFGGDPEPITLERGQVWCVAQPDDGKLFWITYNMSGLGTAEEIRKVLLTYSSDVVIDRGSVETLLKTAKSVNARYLLIPDINYWERISIWSFRSSSVSLNVTIYDVQTGNILISEKMVSRQKGRFNISHPQDLLQVMIKNFIDGFYWN